MCADKPSALYAVINKATTNIPSQYATPTVRTPIAAEKEQKVDAYTGLELSKQTDIYEEIKMSDMPLKEVKRNTNKSSTTTYSVEFALAIISIIVMIVVVSMVIALFVQMRTLHEMNKDLQKSVEKLNHDKSITKEQTNLSQLYNLVLSLHSKIKQFNISFMNVHEEVNDFISAHNNTSSEIQTSFSLILDFYLSSCSDIARLNYSYASGNYIVRSSTGVLRSVYCDMNRTFGGNSTGWMRVAELDVNNCPPGLRHEITSSVNTCVVIEDNPACTEITYPVFNTQYTQITGQIRGYNIRTLDGFDSWNSNILRPTYFTDLRNNYLDGISISTIDQHIWSFAAGCNCLNTNNKPTIIGQDYTCDGVTGFSNDLEIVWATQQCGRNFMWFYKVVFPTTTDIKVRICRDENRNNEDLAIKSLQLYIQ